MSAHPTIPAQRLAPVIPLSAISPSAHTTATVRLRLTHRGRVVFGVLGVLLALAAIGAALLLGSPQAVATAEESSAEFGYVIVQPGASLWSVATELDPQADPRDIVAELVRLNQMGGSGVQAGQPIAVPLRYADAPGVVSAADLGME